MIRSSRMLDPPAAKISGRLQRWFAFQYSLWRVLRFRRTIRSRSISDITSFIRFASSDGTPLETDTEGPALEFNWGALPNVHLHIIVPLAAALPAHGSANVRSGRHRTGNQIPVCAGRQASSHDRHIYDVRDADGQRRTRI